GAHHWRRGVKAVDDRHLDELWQGAEVRTVDEDKGAPGGWLVAGCQWRRRRERPTGTRLTDVDRLRVGLLGQQANNLGVCEAGAVDVAISGPVASATAGH